MKEVRALCAVCVLCSAIVCSAVAADYPTHTVRQATGRIVIDGILDEADWAAAESFGDFVFPWYTGGEQEQSEVKMLWDDTFLYVAFACDDTHIWAEHFSTNASVSRDDCAELFWNPDPDNSLSFYQFEINCVGNILSLYYNFEGGRGSPRNTIMIPHIAQTIDGTVNDDSDIDTGWIIEYAFRFEDYPELSPKPAPEPGDSWRIGLHRCGGKTNPQYSQWSASRTERPNYHRPQDFGTLIFSGAPVR